MIYYDYIKQAFTHREVCQALGAYATLRSALVAPDDLGSEACRALAERAQEAAERYSADSGGPVQEAENAVLLAYAAYLRAVVQERASTFAHQCEAGCDLCSGGT
jgi:hypothetical protein